MFEYLCIEVLPANFSIFAHTCLKVKTILPPFNKNKKTSNVGCLSDAVTFEPIRQFDVLLDLES